MFGRTTKEAKTSTTSSSRSKPLSPSVIAEGMHILGNVVSDGVIDMNGHIDGNVRAETISVRENGRIRGDVIANTIHVYGEIEGLIKAQTVMLYATARVTGTIMHESLTIEDGAFVDGKFKRTVPEGEAPRQLTGPTIDSMFDNDNDDEPSEAEIRILENLRLIS